MAYNNEKITSGDLNAPFKSAGPETGIPLSVAFS